MKCPSCGAESSGTYCEYCGSEMPKTPIVVNNNFYGTQGNTRTNESVLLCDQCNSNNISFQREETYYAGYYKTVAICNSCGNTWVVSQDDDSMMPGVTGSFSNNYQTEVRLHSGSSKQKSIALLLCVFGGYFGLHYFYVGKIGMGILYFLTGGLCGIGWIVDIFRIAVDSFSDKDGCMLT